MPSCCKTMGEENSVGSGGRTHFNEVNNLLISRCLGVDRS